MTRPPHGVLPPAPCGASPLSEGGRTGEKSYGAYSGGVSRFSFPVSLGKLPYGVLPPAPCGASPLSEGGRTGKKSCGASPLGGGQDREEILRGILFIQPPSKRGGASAFTSLLPPSERGVARSAGGSTPCGASGACSRTIPSFRDSFTGNLLYLSGDSRDVIVDGVSTDSKDFQS